MSTIKRGTKYDDLPPAFRTLLGRLKAFTVKGWERDSDGPLWPAIHDSAPVAEADVVSSELVHHCTECGQVAPEKDLDDFGLIPGTKHLLVIDVDYPAYLVESSTEGHYHLYLDVPGGIPHAKWVKLMKALGEAGVIQPGYHSASLQREHSDVRLPWVSKADLLEKAGLA